MGTQSSSSAGVCVCVWWWEFNNKLAVYSLVLVRIYTILFWSSKLVPEMCMSKYYAWNIKHVLSLEITATASTCCCLVHLNVIAYLVSLRLKVARMSHEQWFHPTTVFTPTDHWLVIVFIENHQVGRYNSVRLCFCTMPLARSLLHLL